MLDYHRYLKFNVFSSVFRDDLSKVYASVLFRASALGLASVFVPIYLLSLGFPVAKVLSFVMVLFFTLGIVSILSAFISKHFGFRVSAFFSAPLLIVYLLGLYSLEYFQWGFPELYLLAFIQGVSAAFFWIPLNVLFTVHSTKKERGEQVGKLNIFPGIASLVAPVVGGFIAVSFGFPTLFLIATFFAFLSVIPLFFGKEEMKPRFEFSFKKIFPKRRIKFFFAFLFGGKKDIAAETLWPIFVYFLLRDTVSIGVLTTLAALGSFGIAYFIGRMTNHSTRYLFMKIGSILLGLTWFIRSFAKTKWEVFGISFLAGVFTILIDIPFATLWMDKANQENPIEFIVFRELVLNAGKTLILLFAIFFVNSLSTFFSFAGLSSFFFLFF